MSTRSATMTGDARVAIGLFLKDAVARALAPGIVAGVVDSEQILLLAAAGQRDVASRADLQPDAIFRIASMTKPVTSLAAMMLAEQGVLDLDDEAAAYLPEFARARVLTRYDDEGGTWESRAPLRPVTIRHLLTHTSGIAYPFLDPRLSKIDDGRTPRADVPLVHDPGERFTYGPSTAMLGSIVEVAAGQPLDDFCRARLFEPLGMIDTGYAVPAAKRDRVITMHTHDASGFAERPNAATIESRGRGDDGLLSTAEDYGRFLQLFLNGGVAGGRRIVQQTTLDAMTENQIGRIGLQRIGLQPAVPGAIASPFPIGGDKDTFGFGFQIETAPPRDGGRGRSVGSCSWSGVFNTYFWIDPVKRIGVTVLMQFLPAHDAGALEILDGVERRVYELL
jgi:methyl acetate hydrolase